MNAHPSVSECDGEYNHDSRKHILQWNLPIIDATNKAGSMEFSVPSSIPGDFFPLQVYIVFIVVNFSDFYKIYLIYFSLLHN